MANAKDLRYIDAMVGQFIKIVDGVNVRHEKLRKQVEAK